MRKKIMAVVLSCLTLLTLIVSSAWAPMHASAVTMDEMTSVAVDIITDNEGTYGSINKNDNGAVSIGILQWHANRALQLMRTIASADTASAKSILGSTFYNEVMSASSWASRTFSASEATAAANLLTSSAGIAAQDALAASDVQGYIQAGQAYGLTDASVLVYFAELYNRGSGIAARIVSSAKGSGSYSSITLSALHNAALADKSNSSGAYTTRLTNAYNTLVSLDWGTVITTTTTTESTTSTSSEAISATSVVVDETADVEAETVTVCETPEDFSESYAGDYVVSASSLNVRSAPNTDASKLGVIENGETITVLSGNGSWSEVVYADGTGYCSMEYLVTASEEIEEVEEVEETEETTIAETTATEETETQAVETTTTTVEAEPVAQAEVEVVGVSDPDYATVYGDVDCDGIVDMKDVVLLQRYLDGYEQFDARQLANADCRRDDVLDETDITVIVQYLIENLTALPIV